MNEWREEAFRRPIAAVDVVVLTCVDGALKVLIGQRDRAPFEGEWGLIGGLIDPAVHEQIEQVARQKLREKSGVEARYVEQLRTYGNRTRSPRGWELSVAHFALLPPSAIDFAGIGTDPRLRWAVVQGESVRPSLTAFDHPLILRDALRRVRAKLEYSPIGAYFLDDEFTIKELREVYQVVMGLQFTEKAFRHQVELAEILEPVAGRKRMATGANRPAQLYRLRAWEGEMPLFFPRQLTRRRGGVPLEADAAAS